MTPALANHLWQSTVFAAAAGLLTLAFRRNRAHVRFWLWLAASLKFLIPFSLLLDLGTSISWTPSAQATAAQIVTLPVSFAAERATQPFLAVPTLAPVAHASGGAAMLLLAAWACGFVAVVAMRVNAWRRVRRVLRASTPMELPVPVDGLKVRASTGRLEPGVVGLFRPVLLLPAGIVERLTRPQLLAVLAHERFHIWRRDNLWAAMHMLVEALFWFYPPVWWIGARMVAERERACDESVLGQGSEARDYAGAIVSVCKYYVESPLACVPGITGADIKRRLMTIMANRGAAPLTRAKRALLASAIVAALAGPAAVGLVIGLGHAPVVFAQAQAKPSGSLPRFTVVSVKPSQPGPITPRLAWQRDSGFWAVQKFTAVQLMINAFMISPQNMVGVPQWASRTRYDVRARMPPGTSDAEFRLMLQALLADRFELKAHQEMRPRDVAILTVDAAGPHLRPASRSCVPPPRNPSGTFGLVEVSPGTTEMAGCSVTMAEVAQFFTAAAVHPVVDETGIKGRFDINVVIDFPKFSRGQDQNEYLRESALAEKNAFQKQLGLDLDFTKLVKRPMPVLVIDHIAPASSN